MKLIKVFVLIIWFQMISSLVIYRRKPKPKLICKDENEWKQIAQAISIGSQAEALLNGTYFEISTTDSEGSDSSESREHEKIKIVPRRLKRNVQQKDKVLLTKGEPVIFLTVKNCHFQRFNGNFRMIQLIWKNLKLSEEN